MSDEPRLYGVTKAEVRDELRLWGQAAEDQRTRERIAQWRARHPSATCNDRIADVLATLEDLFGRKPTP